MNKAQQSAQQTEIQNAQREQLVINTRILSLKHAKALANLRMSGDINEFLDDAKKIEAYLTGNIESIKPKSSLVMTSVMPPPAAGFKPGD